jgi:FlaA1/EpsC-like NDP-sugar epimerase
MLRSRFARTIGIVGIHGVVWILSLAIALPFVGARAPLTALRVAMICALFLTVKGAAAIWAGSFRELWRHTGLEDLAMMIAVTAATIAVLWALLLAAPALGVPPSLALVDGILSIAFVGALRIGTRIVRELLPRFLERREKSIVLAGRVEAVEIELRRIHVAGRRERVVGLMLDGPPLDGARLRGVRVLAPAQLKMMLSRRAISEVRLVPPASPNLLQTLQPLCKDGGVGLRRLHYEGDLESGGVDDLLERPELQLDGQAISVAIAGRRLLVTGAGGSIGSGLCRQLIRYRPEALILVDRSENALFQIERELAECTATQLHPRILDVRDRDAVERLFASLSPDIVFHAAAHKHVPLMERQPAEAVLNNVVGTRNLVDAADAYGVDAFVFISTDKAVHPSSVMGATKRVGELYVRAMARRSEGRFVAVRFGNVIGSSGSVVPIFMEQIKRGDPVTVTHADMRRFFMSIPEACQLVLQAAALGFGGDLFVLEMGQPIRILDLARRLIERAGLRPDVDIPIVFSGPRPGEKLDEQLTFESEITKTSRFPGLQRISSESPPLDELCDQLDELERLAHTWDNQAVLELLGEVVPEYRARSRDDEVERAQLEPQHAAT